MVHKIIRLQTKSPESWEGLSFANITSKISEEELEVLIPSYPASELSLTRSISWLVSHTTPETNQDIVDSLHSDNEFLVATMMGNEIRMNQLIRENEDNVVYSHGVDILGRTALHLAVVTDNVKCVELALRCGINPNIKDKLGMTALAMCLMQRWGCSIQWCGKNNKTSIYTTDGITFHRPSLEIIKLLFQNGATITPRDGLTDVGLFLRFVMMCKPTAAEEAILRLLINNGALINDPEAPGERQALHFAAMSNNCDLINVLVKLGANLNVTNRRNETPLEVALSFKCKAAADLLKNMMSSATDVRIKCTSLTVPQSDSPYPSTSNVKRASRCTIISFD